MRSNKEGMNYNIVQWKISENNNEEDILYFYTSNKCKPKLS